MFAPRSPRREDNVYRPMSPRRDIDTYRPASPRLGNTRVEQLIRKMTSKEQPDVFVKTPFRPLYDYENHIRMMRTSGEFSDDFLDKFHQQHVDFYRRYPQPEKKKFEDPLQHLPKYADDVVTRTITNTDGTTTTKEEAPMAEFASQNIFKVPINKYIKAMKKFGYPNEYLKKTLTNYQKILKEQHKAEKVFNRVFASYGTSKTVKTKKRHIRDKVAKFIIKSTKLDDDEE